MLLLHLHWTLWLCFQFVCTCLSLLLQYTLTTKMPLKCKERKRIPYQKINIVATNTAHSAKLFHTHTHLMCWSMMALIKCEQRIFMSPPQPPCSTGHNRNSSKQAHCWYSCLQIHTKIRLFSANPFFSLISASCRLCGRVFLYRSGSDRTSSLLWILSSFSSHSDNLS